ncbi:MAG: fused MFS/spermidine synthase [Rhodocyclaceae bacterium]|jgi:spermidine synthase|nr:Polyamine aminopropyltransferase [Rhodocyclaceae bacterium]MBZ0142662.1 fused MFS/spermidine synthase [Rhodocyclaceae bacterium]MCL4679843.1 fused MFS/spermidine synthase [Rhodocyclaceae bacterium]
MATPIDISEEGGVRYLHFGSDWIQGAMRIARPWALELDYTREMMAALLLRPEPDWPRKALLIGLGAASLTKFLYRHRPRAKLTVVEIEPAVVAAAHRFFKLPDDPKRIRIEIADGVEWLAGSGEAFDLILVDGFDADARAGALDTLPFYRACRAHLDDSGLLAVNLLGRNRGFKASVERIGKAFDGRAMVFPSCDHGNAIAFAAAGDAVSMPLGELSVQALALRKASGLNLLPTVARLAQWQTCPGGRLEL